MGKRLVNENIVHIEGVFGKLKAALAQHAGPVDDGVHQDILALHEKTHILPVKELILGKCCPVVHDLFAFCPLFFVYEIAYQHIQGIFLGFRFLITAQDGEDFLKSFFIYPVIAVYYLKESAGGIAQAGIDCFTVAAVFLVDSPADVRITGSVFIGDLSRSVLGRPIVHDQNFDLRSSGKKSLDAVTHIVFGIVAGNRYR